MPDVHVGKRERDHAALRAEVGAERDHGHGRERGDHRDDGRQRVVEPVHVARQGLLLEDELQAVGQQLDRPRRCRNRTPGIPTRNGDDRAVRARPALDPGRDLALGHRARGRDREDDADDREALDEGLDNRRQPEEEIDRAASFAAGAAGVKCSAGPSANGRPAQGAPSRRRPVSGMFGSSSSSERRHLGRDRGPERVHVRAAGSGPPDGADEPGQDDEVVGAPATARDGRGELLDPELLVHEGARCFSNTVSVGTTTFAPRRSWHCDGCPGRRPPPWPAAPRVRPAADRSSPTDTTDLDAARRRSARASAVELRPRKGGDEPRHQGPADVRVAVRRDEEPVALPHPADEPGPRLQRLRPASASGTAPRPNCGPSRQPPPRPSRRSSAAAATADIKRALGPVHPDGRQAVRRRGLPGRGARPLSAIQVSFTASLRRGVIR